MKSRKLDYALFAGMLGAFGGRHFRRDLSKLTRPPKTQKPKASILKVIKLTPGRQHAWCETNFGVRRKNLNSIPSEIRNSTT